MRHAFAASDRLFPITAHAREYFHNLESFDLEADQAFKSTVHQHRASNDTACKLRYAIIASDRVGKKELQEEADAIRRVLNGDDKDGY